MEDYELSTRMETPRPMATEDRFTKTIEEYTSAMLSSGYLAVAIGAMGLSLICQVTGNGKWGNFIAQWTPTWLIIGVYNKLVKLEGHDRFDRGNAEEIGEYACDFCDSKFSLQSDRQNHQKHCSVRNPVS